MKIFTSKELAKFNGQNGNPAYVAAHGKVFDVTNNPYWIKGMKRGMPVGIDWTRILDAATPQTSTAFKGLPRVGSLED